MDRFGPLPLTLEQLRQRLERGEVLTIIGAGDGLDCSLFLNAERRIILRQGGQEHPFKQLEVAVLTLLCSLGEFSSSNRDTVDKDTVGLDPAESGFIDDRVREIVADLFSIDKAEVGFYISLSSDLGASGWGLDHAELAMRLENAFHISIGLEEAAAWETVGDVQRYLQSKGVL